MRCHFKIAREQLTLSQTIFC